MKDILLVDDEPLVRRVVRLILEPHGVRCVEAQNGQEALKILDASYPVDLVITDNRMPVMSGQQLIARVRRSPTYGQVPILLLSGHLTDELEAEANQPGVLACLSKPLDVGDLIETVGRLINLSPVELSLS